MSELEGKTALVTGASRGIGRGIAEELARAGAFVIVGYRSRSAEAEEVAAAIGGVAVCGDVGTAEGCAALLEAGAERGGLDILVNNAGVTRDNIALKMSDADWHHVLDVNASGTFRLCRGALDQMFRQRSGAIVNIVSLSGIHGNIGQANYAASKGAVIALTKTLAKEMARRKIRINAVAPGLIETDMLLSAIPDEALAAAKKSVPMRRLGTPADIAPLVRFLCGPGSAYMTGQVITVDGGLAV
ncbi:MAG: 3-oxoacyl-ACP reductase FabG [Proteobacteria bacterium]|nr:3-oxoacyl-ACP reductase FabG [Pseudomonadota bacterium]